MLRELLSVAVFVVALGQVPGRTMASGQMQTSVEGLRLGTYATSGQVAKMAIEPAFREQVHKTIERMGITKLYIEVYRGGHTVPPAQLVEVRDWLKERGIDVVGGIATVPGGDVGVRQEGPLGWFNWQDAKTQRDLEQIIRASAPLFDTFIVDDFLCTGDVSAESARAKGDRSWGAYRRALLTELAQSIFVGPAKGGNPDITMIVKFPQWHDRFHLFGYDTESFPRIFDRVWVGTETRGRHTQRFGFVQPYEGYINYRWLADIAGAKIGGAWFDHGDCAEHDFLDQAYMSVLAGAPELVFFNLGNVVAGHPDHAKVIAQFDQLTDLAAFVREHPVAGVPAYKPPNSDPAGDMYLMDFLGMLGIPLVPVHEFPQEAPVIFLPAQAASDPALDTRVAEAQARGAHLIMTTNLLVMWPRGREFAATMDIDADFVSAPVKAAYPSERGDVAIDLEVPVEVTPRPGDVVCADGPRQLLLLRTAGHLSLLNTHTFNQADFDAVGEVLLCPRPLGLLDLDGPALAAFRKAFAGGARPVFTGPAGVTYHPFTEPGRESWVIQNFNDEAVQVSLIVRSDQIHLLDRFLGRPLPVRARRVDSAVRLTFTIPARDRVWVWPTTDDTVR